MRGMTRRGAWAADQGSYVSVLKDIFGSRVIETALRALGPYLAQERQGHYVEGDSEEIVSFETLVLYMCNVCEPPSLRSG